MTVRVGARVAIALLALLPAGLSGCGQTGPLYMPPEPEPETVPQAQSAAATYSAEQQTKDP